MHTFSFGTSIGDILRPQFYTMLQDGKIPAQAAAQIPQVDISKQALSKYAKMSSWIQTPKGPKLLALVQNRYLLWFQPTIYDTSNIQPTSPSMPVLLSKEDTEILQHDCRLQGFSDLRGMFVRGPRTSPLDLAFNKGNGVLSPRSRLQSVDSEQPFQQSNHATRLVNPTLGSFGAVASSANNPASTASEFFLAFCHQPDEAPLEVFHFPSQEHLETWRVRIACSPVIFTDFETRYTILDHQAKEGSRKIGR